MYSVHRLDFQDKAILDASFEKIEYEMSGFLFEGQNHELDNQLLSVDITVTFFEINEKNIMYYMSIYPDIFKS